MIILRLGCQGKIYRILAVIVLLFGIVNISVAADNSAPPSPVRLIFIHHSVGGNWLADTNSDNPSGGLGKALMDNNYYVSATNYGWGPDGIGDCTDILCWPTWFTGSQSNEILEALYEETEQNFEDSGYWSRLDTMPDGENEIILLKSCYYNSDLFGNSDDPAGTEINDQSTVSNAKAVYNNLLTYFVTRPDKLFIIITAPPMLESEYYQDSSQTIDERAANIRAFNNWLVNDWLDSYSLSNVHVFDYYNVLTGADNHHRWNNNEIEHVVNTNYNYTAYPCDEYDSHPSSAGHRKATEEFIDLINYYYNTWKETSEGEVATAESIALAQQLYIGYYGRPADPDGLAYWAAVFDQSTDLDQALNAFGTSIEYTENFGLLSNQELVNNLYQQMFGRDAETAGLNFYTECLQNGQATLTSIAKQIADGASGDDLIVLNNRITVAESYTDAVSEFDADYGPDNIEEARNILSAVDNTDDSVTIGINAAVDAVSSDI